MDSNRLRWIALDRGVQIFADMCDLCVTCEISDSGSWRKSKLIKLTTWCSSHLLCSITRVLRMLRMLRMLRATFPNIFRTWLLHGSVIYRAGVGFT